MSEIQEKRRFRLTPAVYLFMERDNKILMLRRANTGFRDGEYSFVAGHVDGGESVKQAAIREAKEEAGILVREEDLELIHTMHRLNEAEGYLDQGEKHIERIDFFMRTDKWEGEIKNMEEDKCDDLSWFDIDSLPDNTIDYIKFVIEEIRKGNIYSEYGWN